MNAFANLGFNSRIRIQSVVVCWNQPAAEGGLSYSSLAKRGTPTSVSKENVEDNIVQRGKVSP